MPDIRHTPLSLLTAGLLLLLGGALAFGGVWLILLGGSGYYLAAGIAFILTAYCLWRRPAVARWIYLALLAGTFVWSLWEVGLDWWPLAARGGLIFVLGLWMLVPGVVPRPAEHRRLAGGYPLAAALALTLVIAAVSWFTDPTQIDGTAPGPRRDVADDALGVPPGEWHAYGRTGHGQRFSPLREITPANADDLRVAWTYHTGDVPGQPGDPVETTFEVTPLKIGNRLYLCTPHQFVIALDATTGAEIWRFDPHIRDQLALQHLTCRGLAYYAGAGAGAGAGTGGGSPGDMAGRIAAAGSRLPELPVAATTSPAVPTCSARLYMPTADGRLIALDPETGSVCADFGGGGGQINLWVNMPNVRPGAYYSTSPVVVARGLVIVGGTVLDNVSVNEQSGVIRAFDAVTGALVWNWDSGNPEDTTPIAPGGTYIANSPNSWSISSADEALGLVYVPLGNQPPDQWGADRSADVERFSSSVVALEIETGRLRWVFQTVHHDLWDYDVPAQPSLVDLAVNNTTIPALVQPTKQGDIFVLDRRTGQPVLPVTERPAPEGAVAGDRASPTQPASALSFAPSPLTGADMWGATLLDQLACRIQFHRFAYAGRFTPPSTQGTLVHPGNFGVFNWGGIAIDPERQIALTTPAYLAFVSRLVPRADDTTMYVQGENRPEGSLPALNENFGAPYAAQLYPFLSPLGVPCEAPPWGYVAAADLTDGSILWRHRNGTVRDLAPIPLPFRMGVPSLGGPITTAGGVAFLTGTLDDYVRAYDVTTGREVWKDRLPAGGQATPMTYTGTDGRQYLLVVAGGHGSLGTKPGDAVIAYALPRP